MKKTSMKKKPREETKNDMYYNKISGPPTAGDFFFLKEVGG